MNKQKLAMSIEVRAVQINDVESLMEVLDSIELFPSEMLDDMIEDYFSNEESMDIWFTAVKDGIPISLGYCAPERLTESTFNLYAIGVRKDLQGEGIGMKMMGYLEDVLKEKGDRILIVETSGSDDFRLTRLFYEKLGYTKEAVIRDFWTAGDDKVIYWKKINAWNTAPTSTGSIA